jgi:hypothetical protein
MDIRNKIKDVREYLDDLRPLVGQMRTASDVEKIWFFSDNLPIDLRQKFKERKCQTLECAMDCLLTIEPTKYLYNSF